MIVCVWVFLLCKIYGVTHSLIIFMSMKLKNSLDLLDSHCVHVHIYPISYSHIEPEVTFLPVMGVSATDKGTHYRGQAHGPGPPCAFI